MVVSMLTLQSSSKHSLFGSLDPRIKILVSLYVLVASMLLSSWFELLVILSITLLVAINIEGTRKFIELIWGLKFYFVLLVAINLLISSQGLVQSSILLIKFLILILAFTSLNRSTSPDEIIDALMKLGLPPTLAWTVGTSYRQATFILRDLESIKVLHEQRGGNLVSGKYPRWIGKPALYFSLLMASYAQAVVRAGLLSNTLRTRGWRGAHREIILNSSSIRRVDLVVAVLSTGGFMAILFLSSQVFM